LFPLLKQVRLKSVQFPRKGVHNPRKQQQVWFVENHNYRNI
jgi:hypothetical protein